VEILLAEDDPITQRMLERILVSQGHQVTVAETGEAALGLYDQAAPQLLLTDWTMPGSALDGIGLVEAVRRRMRRDYIYIIMITANTGQDHLLRAMRAGADDFLTKPLQRQELDLRLMVAERILGFRNQFIRMGELIPMCAVCKRIRDDHDYWKRVESFLEDNLNQHVTHGLCPECLAASPRLRPKG
jgi:phosphoserine phosphatase RsbU/P